MLTCPLCAVIVSPDDDLELHLRLELNYAAWKCRICSVDFFTFDDATAHFEAGLSRHPGSPLSVFERLDRALEMRIRDALNAVTTAASPSALPPLPLDEDDVKAAQTPLRQEVGDVKPMPRLTRRKPLTCSSCDECGARVSSNRHALLLHVSRRHLRATVFECRVCDWRSRSWSNRGATRHSETRHPGLLESFADRRARLRPHYEAQVDALFGSSPRQTVTDSRKTCRDCQAAVSDNTVFHHIARRHFDSQVQILKCGYCTYAAPGWSANSIQKHQARRHPELPPYILDRREELRPSFELKARELFDYSYSFLKGKALKRRSLSSEKTPRAACFEESTEDGFKLEMPDGIFDLSESADRPGHMSGTETDEDESVWNGSNVTDFESVVTESTMPDFTETALCKVEDHNVCANEEAKEEDVGVKEVLEKGTEMEPRDAAATTERPSQKVVALPPKKNKELRSRCVECSAEVWPYERMSHIAARHEVRAVLACRHCAFSSRRWDNIEIRSHVRRHHKRQAEKDFVDRRPTLRPEFRDLIPRYFRGTDKGPRETVEGQGVAKEHEEANI